MTFSPELFPRRAWIPCSVTFANIAVGFTSMLVAAAGRFDTSVYLLVVAILLDLTDGRLARSLGATSPFGQQLDSFSDALSFGAAPAFLVHQAVLRELGGVGAAAALAFVLAGVFRLARFNLLSDAHEKAARTLGVPIPIGAGYLMAVVLMRGQLPTPWAAAVVVLVAALMVSHWRLPDLKGRGLVSAMLIVGIFNYLAVVARPNWYTVGWWNLWNVLILAAAHREDHRPEMTAARS